MLVRVKGMTCYDIVIVCYLSMCSLVNTKHLHSFQILREKRGGKTAIWRRVNDQQ